MNFLAHLWLADRSGTSLSGAILGDMVRGSDLSAYPPELQQGIRIHRRIDAATDRHPAIVAARVAFPQGARRFAGIVLDVVCDHLLAIDWGAWSAEALPAFADRAGAALASDARWFELAGNWTPRAAEFSRLLQSYAEPAGVDHALRRTAARMREPRRLLAAAADWQAAARSLRPRLGELLDDLRRVETCPGEPDCRESTFAAMGRSHKDH